MTYGSIASSSERNYVVSTLQIKNHKIKTINREQPLSAALLHAAAEERLGGHTAAGPLADEGGRAADTEIKT